MSRCLAFSSKVRDICKNNSPDGSVFCSRHAYLTDQYNNYKTVDNLKYCSRGKHFKYPDDFIRNEEEMKVCNACSISAKKYIKPEKIGCIAPNRYAKKCNKKPLNGEYCKLHLYFNDYTDEQKAKLTLCKGCIKYKYNDSGKICNECKNRGSKNREINKNTLIKCKKENCEYKVMTNGYCGKHQILGWKDEIEMNGGIVCINYIRGCRTILDANARYRRCKICRGDERKKYKDEQNKIQEYNDQIEENNKIQCTKCKNKYEKSNFVNKLGKIGRKCIVCLGRQRNWGKSNNDE